MQKRTSILVFVLHLGLFSFSQGQKPFNLNGDVFGLRVFIENKGQFDQELPADQTVKYAYCTGAEKIFFTDKGVVYKMGGEVLADMKEMEEVAKGNKKAEEQPVYLIQVNWKGCNPNINIKQSNKQGHYFAYDQAKEKCYGYKTITYENVYNGIDIEYTMPADKTSGIKYNVIVHPGADPELLKIAYSGNILSATKDDKGNIHIKTPVDEIIEHAPYSFLEDKSKVESNFVLENFQISFKLPVFDKTKFLIIDPWVSTTSGLTTHSSAFDVDYDYNGNLYVYGGSAPSKVSKYDIAGNLSWTFPGFVASQSWSSTTAFFNNISSTGNFAVSRLSGKTYIGKPSGTSWVRLDQLGNYDNYIYTANNFLECWDMGYQCVNDHVFAFGGYTSTVSYLDQTTPTISVTYTHTAGKDIQSAVFDDNGNLFIHRAPNTLDRLNTAYTMPLWSNPTGFTTLPYGSGKPNYISSMNGHGFNALGVSINYLYFYDGFNLAAYNKTTGTQIAATTIAAHSIKFQGGIAVDDCDNLYLGGNNGTILKYHFNGTSFVAQGSISPNITTTNKFIYDIKFFKQQNTLFYCGTGFAGVIGAGSTCNSSTLCVLSIPPSYTTVCYGTSAILTIPNLSNLNNPSYTVQPGNLVSTNPNFTVTPLVTTVYTVAISGMSSASVIVTQTAISTVSVLSAPAASPSLVNGTCANPVTSSVNLNITFNPSASINYTLNWSPIPSSVTVVNSSTAAGLVPGVNNVTITSEDGCTVVASFSVPPIPLPANFVIVNPSNDYTVTCINPNVLLTTSVTNGVPLTYTWFPTCTNTLTGSSMNFTQNCVGQVVGQSSTGCQYVQTYTVYQDFTSPTIAITPSVQNLTCAGGSGCFTLTSNLGPNVTTNWFYISGTNTLYVGAAQGTINIFCAGSPGAYWGESVYNITGCRTTQSVQVTASVGVPIFTLTSPTNFTIGCGSKSITSMQVTSVITSPVPNVPVNYTFMIPPVTGTPTTFSTNPNLNNITIPGTYVVYIKDLTNSCISSQSVSIIQNTIAPTINFIQPLPQLTCRDYSMVMTGISSNTNTQITWTVPAFPGSSVNPTPNATVVTMPSITGATANVVAIGIWTVGAMDNNNFCSASKTVQINQDIRLPRFTISALSNSVITCKNPDVVIVPVVTPTLAVALVPTYVWYPPVGPASPGSQFNSTAAGTHTSISTSVVNGCTYSATYNVAIDVTQPSIQEAGPFILDCHPDPTVAIIPAIAGPTTGLTYTWTVPSNALTTNLNAATLISNALGNYFITITNTVNGCEAYGIYQVTEGSIKADFVPNTYSGFAPLHVLFDNTSSTSTGASSIISTWGYGNGAITQTILNTVQTSATYTAPGTYSVYLKVQKGTCVDVITKTILVEIASKLEIPNVFTPNGDKVNDVFKLRASNLNEVYIVIFDRWGSMVYELTSDTGNFAWDGKNQFSKNCADGTYFYILKAKGKDGEEYDLKGYVSLFR